MELTDLSFADPVPLDLDAQSSRDGGFVDSCVCYYASIGKYASSTSCYTIAHLRYCTPGSAIASDEEYLAQNSRRWRSSVC